MKWKKIIQRKALVGFLILGLLFICGGFDIIIHAIKHQSAGYVTYGGDAPDYSGQPPTEEHTVKVSQDQYKRHEYLNGGLSIIFGGFALWGAIAKWKERDDLEKTWTKLIKSKVNIRDIHQNQELYRDDFKQWIKDNHPHLAFWEMPKNSSN